MATIELVVIAMETALVVWLIRRVRDISNRALSDNEWHHAQSTKFGTLVGLFRVLEKGLENGGLSPEVRKTIYAAAEETIETYAEKPPVREPKRRIFFG